MMVELRYVVSEGTHILSGIPRLQWRVHQPTVDIGGNLCPGDWTDWENVPVVVLPPPQQESKG